MVGEAAVRLAHGEHGVQRVRLWRRRGVRAPAGAGASSPGSGRPVPRTPATSTPRWRAKSTSRPPPPRAAPRASRATGAGGPAGTAGAGTGATRCPRRPRRGGRGAASRRMPPSAHTVSRVPSSAAAPARRRRSQPAPPGHRRGRCVRPSGRRRSARRPRRRARTWRDSPSPDLYATAPAVPSPPAKGSRSTRPSGRPAPPVVVALQRAGEGVALRPRGQEVLPGPTADRLGRREVRAGPDGAGGPSGEPEWQNQTTHPTGPQVAAEQRAHLVRPWPGQVRHQARGRAEREIGESGPTSAVSMGWKRNPAGTGTTGSRAICCTVVKSRSWNWGRVASSRAGRSRPRPARRRAWTRSSRTWRGRGRCSAPGPGPPDDRDVHQGRAPAGDAASTRCSGLELVALLLPAQCTMISTSTAAAIPSPAARSPVHPLDPLRPPCDPRSPPLRRGAG